MPWAINGIGARVWLIGDHPWKGYSGVIVRWERTMFGDRPVVKLDSGHECFVMMPDQMQFEAPDA